MNDLASSSNSSDLIVEEFPEVRLESREKDCTIILRRIANGIIRDAEGGTIGWKWRNALWSRRQRLRPRRQRSSTSCAGTSGAWWPPPGRPRLRDPRLKRFRVPRDQRLDHVSAPWLFARVSFTSSGNSHRRIDAALTSEHLGRPGNSLENSRWSVHDRSARHHAADVNLRSHDHR